MQPNIVEKNPYGFSLKKKENILNNSIKYVTEKKSAKFIRKIEYHNPQMF